MTSLGPLQTVGASRSMHEEVHKSSFRYMGPANMLHLMNIAISRTSVQLVVVSSSFELASLPPINAADIHHSHHTNLTRVAGK